MARKNLSVHVQVCELCNFSSKNVYIYKRHRIRCRKEHGITKGKKAGAGGSKERPTGSGKLDTLDSTSEFLPGLDTHESGPELSSTESSIAKESPGGSTVSDNAYSSGKPRPSVNRNYQCTKCDLRTNRSRVFLYHLVQVHGSKTDIYACRACEYCSRYRHKIQRHMKVGHGLDIPVEEILPELENTAKRRVSSPAKVHKKPSAGKTSGRKLMVKFSKPQTGGSPGAESPKKKGSKSPNSKVSGDQLSRVVEEIQGDDGKTLYKCRECPFVSDDSQKVAKHMVSWHVDIKHFNCTKCGYICFERNDFLSHRQSHRSDHQYQCQDCTYSTDFRPNYERHMNNHRGTYPFKCNFCSYGCGSDAAIRRHMALNHEENLDSLPEPQTKKVKIPVSKAATSSPSTADSCEAEQLSVSTGSEKGPTSKSKKSSTTSQSLPDQTSPPKIFFDDESATMVPRRTLPPPTLTSHHLSPRELSPLRKLPVNITSFVKRENEKLVCPACNQKGYKRSSDLNRHMKRKHGCRLREYLESLKGADFEGADFSSIGDISDVSFGNISGDDVNDDAYEDMEIDDDLNDSGEMADDVGSKSGEEDAEVPAGKLKCKYCTYEAKLPSELRRHLSVHAIERRFKCTFCPKKYKYIGDMNLHIRKDHNKEPSDVKIAKVATIPRKKTSPAVFKCPCCTYTSAWKSEVDRHSRLHTGEKTFACSKCDYQTYWRGDIRRHVYKHHPDIMADGATIDDVIIFRKDRTPEIVGSSKGSSDAQSEDGSSSTSSRAALDRTTPESSSSREGTSKEGTPELMFDDNLPIMPRTVEHSPTPSPIKEIGGGMYKCLYCGFEASAPSKMNSHIASHTNLKRYMCPLCGRRANWKWDVAKHIKKEHGDETTQVVKLTKEEAESSIKAYMEANPGAKREHQLNKTNTIEKISLPVLIDPALIQYYKCSQCEYSAEKKVSVSQHIRFRHAGQGSVELDKKPSPVKLQEEMGMSTPTKDPNQAITLSAACMVQDTLTPSKFAHLFENFIPEDTLKPFMCSECGKRAASKGDVKKHFHYLHPDKEIRIIYLGDGSQSVFSAKPDPPSRFSKPVPTVTQGPMIQIPPPISPSKFSDVSTSPSVSSVRSTSPSKSSDVSPSPSKSSVRSTSPSKSSGVSTSPSKFSDNSTSPSKSSDVSTSPTKSSVRSTSPNKSSDVSTLPSKSSDASVSPSKSSVTSTWPSKSLTTLPAPSKSLTTLPAPSKSLTTLPAPSKSLTTLPAPSKPLTTLPAPSKSLTTLPAPSKSLASLLAPSKSLTSLPAPSKFTVIPPSPSKSSVISPSPSKSSVISSSPSKSSETTVSPSQTSNATSSPGKSAESVASSDGLSIVNPKVLGYIKPFKCELCGRRSNWRWDLRKHLREKHPGENGRIIELTEQEARLTYDDYQASELPQLNKTSNSIPRKRQSSGSETREEPVQKLAKFPVISGKGTFRQFKCSVCAYRSNWKTDIMRHISRRHGAARAKVVVLDRLEAEATLGSYQYSRGPNIKKEVMDSEYDAQEVEQLDETINKKVSVTVPVLKVPTPKSIPKKIWQCALCPFKDVEKIEALKHIATHNMKAYRCIVCNWTSNFRSAVYKHIRNKHTGNTEAVCRLSIKLITPPAPEEASVEPFEEPSATDSLISTSDTSADLSLTEFETQTAGTLSSETQISGTQSSGTQSAGAESAGTQSTEGSPDGRDPSLTPVYCCKLCAFRSTWRSCVCRHIRCVHMSKEYCKNIVKKIVRLEESQDREGILTPSKLKQMGLPSRSYRDPVRPIKGLMSASPNKGPATASPIKGPTSASPMKGPVSASPVVPSGSDTDGGSTSRPRPKNFKCTICPYKASKSKMIKFHMTCHKPQPGIKQVKCKYCPYYVNKNRLLSQHMALHMQDMSTSILDIPIGSHGYPITPTKDGSTTPSPIANKRHKCEKCPYTSNSKNDYLYHKQFHRPKPTADYKCDFCEYWVTHRRLIKQHMKVHLRERGFAVPASPVRTPVPSAPPTPAKSEYSESALVYDTIEIAAIKQRIIASKITPSISQTPLVSPMKIASSCMLGGKRGFMRKDGTYRKIHKCRHCPYMNIRLRNMKLHELMHGKRSATHPLMKCPHCDYYVGSKGLLAHHLKVHQSDYGIEFIVQDKDKKQETGEEASEDSEIDTSSIPIQSKVDTLLEIARFKKYGCEKCPYASAKRTRFQRHIELHGSRQKYKCEHCDYSVPTQTLLTQHARLHTEPNQNLLAAQSILNLQHLPEMPADVALASMLANNDARHPVSVTHDHVDLYENMPEDSEPKKIYRCDRCPYANIRRDHLLAHLRCHMIRNTFSCPYCDYSVSKIHVLMQHVKVHFSPLPELSEWLTENGDKSRIKEIKEKDLREAIELARLFQNDVQFGKAENGTAATSQNKDQKPADQETVKPDEQEMEISVESVTETKPAVPENGVDKKEKIKDVRDVKGSEETKKEMVNGDDVNKEKQEAKRDMKLDGTVNNSEDSNDTGDETMDVDGKDESMVKSSGVGMETEGYVCQYCDREFQTSNCLVRHEMQHLIGNSYEELVVQLINTPQKKGRAGNKTSALEEPLLGPSGIVNGNGIAEPMAGPSGLHGNGPSRVDSYSSIVSIAGSSDIQSLSSGVDEPMAGPSGIDGNGVEMDADINSEDIKDEVVDDGDADTVKLEGSSVDGEEVDRLEDMQLA